MVVSTLSRSRVCVYSVQFPVQLDLWEAVEDDAMEISKMTSSLGGVTRCLCGCPQSCLAQDGGKMGLTEGCGM